MRAGRRVAALLAAALAAAGAAAQAPPAAEAVRLYEQGLSRQLAEDYTGAIDSYHASLRANPAYVLPMVGLAESFHALGEHDEALQWVVEARKGERRSLELAVLEARIRAAAGDLAAARALLGGVLAQAPGDPQARIALARVETADGNRREAVLQLEQAVAAAPDNPEALLELAQAYEAAGQRERADSYLRRALDRTSEDPRIHLAAGRSLLARGDLAGARRSLERALAIRPGYAEAQLALAETHLAAGRFREAADEARKALASADERIRKAARYLGGVAAARLNDAEGALRSLTEAVRIAPDDEVARIAAENLALRRSRETAAFRRDLAAWHYREGRRLEERNLLPMALLELRRALRLDDERTDARLAYAEVHRLRGYPIRALNELLVLRDHYGVREPAVTDAIEEGCSSLADTAAGRWLERLGVLKGCGAVADQYGLARSPAALAVFTVAGSGAEFHYGSAAELAEYARDQLLRYDHLELSDSPLVVASLEEAHAAARRAGSDYYVVFTFDELERSLRASASFHLSRTGRRLTAVTQLRTGNNRVRDAVSRLTEQVAELVPMRGVIVARETDRALVDLGRAHGLAANTRLPIVRRAGLGTHNSEARWTYRDEDVVGELEVTGVDERVAEGTIRPGSFFDLVNPGDFVVFAPEKPGAN